MPRSTWPRAVASHATSLALDLFRRLPAGARRAITRVLAPSYTLGAVAVVTDDAGQVLLLRSRHQRGWNLPGGLVGRGEDPDTALRRELHEELGVTLPPGRVEDAPRDTLVDPRTRQVTVVVVLHDLPALAGGDLRVDGVEILGHRWFAGDALPGALVRGTAESVERARRLRTS